jgi:hypothetical protein
MDPAALAKLVESQPSTSELAARVQRLEVQLAQARAEINEMRQDLGPRREVSPAVRERARLGGLARAADAARYSDGTFMSGETVAKLFEQQGEMLYERHARGGRARAYCARRDDRGRYI